MKKEVTRKAATENFHQNPVLGCRLPSTSSYYLGYTSDEEPIHRTGFDFFGARNNDPSLYSGWILLRQLLMEKREELYKNFKNEETLYALNFCHAYREALKKIKKNPLKSTHN